MGYAFLQELAKLGKWHAKFLMLFLSGVPQRAGRINHVFIAPPVKGRGEQRIPTGCVFLGWGWRGVLDTWLVTLLAVILTALAGGRKGVWGRPGANIQVHSSQNQPRLLS